MNWYRKSAKNKTAPIPENFDTYEKSEEYPEWRLSVGGGDWETSWSLMAFEFGDAQRVWAVIAYPDPPFKNFTNNNGESDDTDQKKEAQEWAELAAETWIKETKKNFEKSDLYEWSFDDACIEVIDSDIMKKYIDDWGIDKHKWVSEDKNKVKERMENYKQE